MGVASRILEVEGHRNQARPMPERTTGAEGVVGVELRTGFTFVAKSISSTMKTHERRRTYSARQMLP